MALTKVSYSMITGAQYNVLDYMSDAGKAAVAAGTFHADVLPKAQQSNVVTC